MTSLEPILSKIPDFWKSAQPPQSGGLPRRKIAFPLRKNRRAQKQKNDEAIFLLGSALTRGRRNGSRAKNFLPLNPPAEPPSR